METKEAKPMGRPKIDHPADKKLPMVRVTGRQLTAYKRAAEASGINFSQWVRGALEAALVKTK